LKEGILPTTNEINVLRYGERFKSEQSSDGFYNLSIPAELLKEVNIVDTPGTNVILERQQRLTEVGPARCCWEHVLQLTLSPRLLS